MRSLNFTLDRVWYATSAALLVIWVATVVQRGLAGVLPIVVFVFLIPLLFGVEGLELAVAALLDRNVDLRGGAKKELTAIQGDKLFGFFPNRQLFVVVSIVLLTIVNTYDSIYVPGFGWTSDHVVTFVFNLAFSTLAVLLLSQIPSKRLALLDAERFFRSTWPICAAVRWVGATRMTEPAEAIVRLLSRVFRYPAQARRPPPQLTLQYDAIDGCWLIMSSDPS